MTPQPPILTRILSIEKHPNADTLEIVKILGFQTVVKQDQYKVGEEVLYFEPDTAFTPEYATELGIETYLNDKTDMYGTKVKVIKEVKLRSVLSEGLLLPVYLLNNYDVSLFPCFKYEAQAKYTRVENAIPETLLFPAYQSLINLRKEPNTFADGQEVVVTEKIHGTNSRVGFFINEAGGIVLQAGSRTVNRKAPEEGEYSLYWLPYQGGLIQKFFEQLAAEGIKSAVIYGELYGPTVQNYGYGLLNKEIAYRAFTLKLDGVVQNPRDALSLFAEYNIETVPVIYDGPYSYATIQQLAETPTLCAPDDFSTHLAEGVVVQAGATIAKYVSSNYLLSKAGKNKLSDI